ncbi:zf-HC2 domain-containing protein [Dactylosporangium sp. NPDC050588]|uniref:zf-HC2 domain-containing protein n=1 Tax=Dactylosporangium sp. NPDC050588 TaxID=3157211 RepID=UPI00340876A2
MVAAGAGNFPDAGGDYPSVECMRFREALSARMDGEEEPVAPALVDAHLSHCGGCRQFQRDAVAATRLVRLQPLHAAPIPAERLLAGFSARPSGARSFVLPSFRGRSFFTRSRLVYGLRVLLGAFGAAQFLLGIAQAANAATTHAHQAGHVFHESAAWNVAIGAGFAWIATRRATPAGALPMLTAFVALLALLSANDLLAGAVETTRLVSHGFVLAGYAIVLALSRPALDPAGPPSDRQRPPRRWGRPPALDEVPPPPAPAPAPLRLVPGPASRLDQAAPSWDRAASSGDRTASSGDRAASFGDRAA